MENLLFVIGRARENKKQNKLGNRHQQTCVSMAYDQARLTTYTENLSISLLAVQGKVTAS